MAKKSLLSQAIAAAGGPVRVAERCGLKSYQAVRKWEKNGLPRTEWTTDTAYAQTICDMCVENGVHRYTAELLKAEQRSAA